jgi:hypothetical protein
MLLTHFHLIMYPLPSLLLGVGHGQERTAEIYGLAYTLEHGKTDGCIRLGFLPGFFPVTFHSSHVELALCWRALSSGSALLRSTT